MLPNECRIKDKSYLHKVVADITLKIIDSITQTESEKTMNDVFLFHLPVMLHSDVCALNKMSKEELLQAGECIFDQGGYFIIDGKEKVIVAQERNVNNKLFVEEAKDLTKYKYQAFIRCTSETDSVFPKTLWLYVTNKDSIHVKVPHIETIIPLFILFRALGIESDLDIITLINLPKEFEKYLMPSIIEASVDRIYGQTSALEYMKNYTEYSKVENVLYVLFEDFFPNVPNKLSDKARMLAETTRQLVMVSSGAKQPADRDNFMSKRVGTSGFLLGDIFKDFYNNFRVETMKILDNRYEFGTNKKTNILDMVNEGNKSQIFGASEKFINGLVKSLKGNWGLSGDASKQGIVQDLNRISYLGFISHIRRTNTPMDTSIKIRTPHQLNTSQYGMMCPCESPDGASIGLLKNMAILCQISAGTPHTVILEALEAAKFKMVMFSDIENHMFTGATKLQINNNWIALVYDPINIVKYIRLLRRNGLINIFISVSWNILENTINILTESGRCCRPLFIVPLKQYAKTATWTELLIGTDKTNPFHNKFINPFSSTSSFDHVIANLEKSKGCIEYIDVEETNVSLIAMTKDDIIEETTHMEIHPSTIFSAYSSTIPMPNHNQAPRNIFSGAQGKQAIGVYATNFNNRIDTMAYLLHYPQKPIVTTRYANYMNVQNLPNGENLIVAIATYMGYNQEDSIIINKQSLENGMFNVTYFKSYISEESKDDKKTTLFFANPNTMDNVKLTKFADYSKIDANGMPILETFIKEHDCIIGKIAKNIETSKKGDPTKDIFVETEQTVTFTSKCEIADKITGGYVDKVFVSQNDKGEHKAKIRLRKTRKPEHGDKMACYSDDTQVLTMRGWIFWKDLTLDDKVASLDHNDKLIYESPINIYKYFCEHDFLKHVCNNDLDLIVTNNHRMYVAGSDLEYDFVAASDMCPMGRYTFQKKTNGIAAPSPVNITETEVWLLGKLFRNGTIKNLLPINFADMMSYRCIEFDVCKKSFDYFIAIKNENFKNDQIRKNVELMMLENVKERVLPSFVWELNLQLASVLFDSIFEKDSSLNENDCNIKELQRLALHAGKSATYRGQCIVIDYKDKFEYINENREMFYQRKYVYCCSVPSGIVYVRRNGKAVFCGNSRHGQKGVIGAILPPEMMPFTKDGLVPDIIINPHAFPTRMTIAHLIECIMAKSGTEGGFYPDGTAFDNQDWEGINEYLVSRNMNKYADEVMYNGITGEQMQCDIFIGPTYYFRLKHMVADKINSRHSGGKVAMTMQPNKGRSAGGGLRIGEMETNVLLSYGFSAFTKESLMERSDKYHVNVSAETGMIIPINKKKRIVNEPYHRIEIPYACKQLLMELEAMSIATHMRFDDNSESEYDSEYSDIADEDDEQ
jgi:DNA-directed RNA polymerase II subunit RPB2